MTVTLALTPGEPAGIGPDLCIQLAQQPPADCRLVILADPALLEARARQLQLPVSVRQYSPESAAPRTSGIIECLPHHLAVPCIAGKPDTANAAYVLETLRTAARGCLDGRFAAMVTGPVQKSIINEAGIPFSGHTEFLADLSHTARVVMMLASRELKVALATTHLPLSAVPSAITAELLEDVIRILHKDLQQKFAVSNPRILVAGLNPHAGENGHLGREEIDVLIPVLEKLKAGGMQLIGPLPADTLFTPRHLQHADAVLAMYHDQGLPVLKYQGFGEAVNITLGMPLIRTSVDHGTALDLAGSGKADTGSLLAAIRMAADMARRQSLADGSSDIE